MTHSGLHLGIPIPKARDTNHCHMLDTFCALEHP